MQREHSSKPVGRRLSIYRILQGYGRGCGRPGSLFKDQLKNNNSQAVYLSLNIPTF